MTELDIETVIQPALENDPGETPRIISDPGPPLIAKEFKVFTRLMGLIHVQICISDATFPTREQ